MGAPTPIDPLAALEQRKLRAEIANLIAARRKALAEAANAEYQVKEATKRRTFFERVLSTTQATVALALVTLLFQIIQYAYTAHQGRKADESKQWKDALKDVTFTGDPKAVGAALNVETFLRSPEYNARAKAVIAGLLPYVTDVNAFDHLFDSLLQQTSWADDSIQLYATAKSVSVAYATQADAIYAPDHKASIPPALWGRFHQELSNELMDLADKSEFSPEVAEAKRREWEIDTITSGLVSFWRKQGTRPRWGKSTEPMDLQGVILRYDGDAPVDLSKLDFRDAYFKGAYLHNASLAGAQLQNAVLDAADMEHTDLAGTRLDGAKVEGANLGSVTSFNGSVWTNVNWWMAARLSPALCEYLSRYPPATSAANVDAQKQRACSAQDAAPPAPATPAITTGDPAVPAPAPNGAAQSSPPTQ